MAALPSLNFVCVQHSTTVLLPRPVMLSPAKLKPGETVKRETARVGAENPSLHSGYSLASCIQTKVLWSPLLAEG